VIELLDKASSFKEKLREKGYRLTAQRQAILDVIAGHEGEHLSPEEIYDIVKSDCPEIGLATVYRTLILLETMDMVYKLDFDDGCYRYELNRNKEDHRHHHLICLKCGCVEEVEEDLLETLENQILKNKGFVVKDHSVEFYGYCADCSIKYEEF
jgi:Fur family ferric uptake transcriptional regulator